MSNDELRREARRLYAMIRDPQRFGLTMAEVANLQGWFTRLWAAGHR